MPRLTNSVTGAVVSVSDETAALLGSEWAEAETEKPKRAARAKKSED